MTDNRILSREIRQVGIGESKTYTADFTALLYGLTLSSVTSVTLAVVKVLAVDSSGGIHRLDCQFYVKA